MEIRRSWMSRPYLSSKCTLFAIRYSPLTLVLPRSGEKRRAKGEKRLSRFVSKVLEEEGSLRDQQRPAARRFLSKHGRRGRFPPHPRPRSRGTPPPQPWVIR